MTADGFQAHADTIRDLASTRGGALIDATSQASAHFDQAAATRSSFPEGLSSTGERLDSLLRTLSDAAADGVRMAEDYRERLMNTAEMYTEVEQHNTSSIDGVEI